MELWQLPAWKIAEEVRLGRLSASQAVESHIRRMESLEPSLNAMITPMPEEARRRALAVDEALSKGADLPLAGVPVAVKDLFCTKGIRTTCGSRILGEWKPPYTATAVRYLEESGAIVIGKANMDEFAMGSSTEQSAFGATSNPWDLSRVPGGSSGGSAAAVAAGYAPIALGSDTGGSVRQPAALCGVYGLKPTYGLVSRWGVIAYASSLDQVGPFSRDLADLALVLEVISAYDPLDSTCVPGSRPRYRDALKAHDLKGQRIGFLKGYQDFDMDDEVKEKFAFALRICQEGGAEMVEVSLPVSTGYGLPCYYIVAPAEASSNLARYDGVQYGLSEEGKNILELYLKTRGKGFGNEVKWRILVGTYVLSSGYYDAYYLVAQKVRRMVADEFARAFSVVDALITPASPTVAFKKGEKLDDPIQMYMSDLFTLPVNLAGLPAVSMNVGYSKAGLPVGVQVVAPKWGEMEVLKVASVLTDAVGSPKVAMGGEG